MNNSFEYNPKRVENNPPTEPVETVRLELEKVNQEIRSPMKVDDFLKLKIEPLKEFVEGLIQVGLTMWIAGSKKFRTAMALYMAVCISSGTSVFGSFATRKARVLYLCLSEDTLRFNKRILSLADLIGLSHFEIITVEKYKGMPFLKRLIRYIVKRKFDVVIIDSLDDVLDFRTKNSYALKAEFIRQLRIIANDTQCAIVVVNHSDKKDLSENLFQAKTLEAGSDNVILVSSVFSEGNRDILTLRHYGKLFPKKDIFLERKHGEQAFTQLDEIPVLESEVELLEKVALLANAGLKQREMSKILNISQSYVSKLLMKVDVSSPEADVVHFDDIEEFLDSETPDEFEEEEEIKRQTESQDSDTTTGNADTPEKGEQDEPEK